MQLPATLTSYKRFLPVYSLVQIPLKFPVPPSFICIIFEVVEKYCNFRTLSATDAWQFRFAIQTKTYIPTLSLSLCHHSHCMWMPWSDLLCLALRLYCSIAVRFPVYTTVLLCTDFSEYLLLSIVQECIWKMCVVEFYSSERNSKT